MSEERDLPGRMKRSAGGAWSLLLVWVLLPVCYLATDPERNLNWVFGIGNPPQTWVSGHLYLVLLMLAYPLTVFMPTHFILKTAFNGR